MLCPQDNALHKSLFISSPCCDDVVFAIQVSVILLL